MLAVIQLWHGLVGPLYPVRGQYLYSSTGIRSSEHGIVLLIGGLY